jgi:hypothetical protein
MNILIYLSGVVVSYLVLRKLRKKYGDNTWSEVIFTVILSLGSWLGIGAVLFVMGVLFLIAKGNEEPPKWL